MTDDAIPQWALDEARKRLTAEGRRFEPTNHTVKVLARMIAKHEQPPADPDEQVVMRVLWAAFPHILICSEDKARALAQYKKEIGRD